MIVGLGIDLCSISRIERLLESVHFRERIFREEELRYAFSKKRPARHLAASFAAREAFSKASSVSMYSVAFQGVWIERTESGPVLRLSERVQSLLDGEKRGRISLSISHDGDFAVAVVVIEALDEILRS